MVGTARFASIPNQQGRPLGPRDDVEALAYMLVFLRSGRLPWSDLPKEGDRRERFARILAAKEAPADLTN